jgi:hypothetical protein
MPNDTYRQSLVQPIDAKDPRHEIGQSPDKHGLPDKFVLFRFAWRGWKNSSTLGSRRMIRRIAPT